MELSVPSWLSDVHFHTVATKMLDYFQHTSGIHAPVGNSETEDVLFRKDAWTGCNVPWFLQQIYIITSSFSRTVRHSQKTRLLNTLHELVFNVRLWMQNNAFHASRASIETWQYTTVQTITLKSFNCFSWMRRRSSEVPISGTLILKWCKGDPIYTSTTFYMH
jgi:hypothetical protein